MRWHWHGIAGLVLGGTLVAQDGVRDQLQRFTERLDELRAQESELIETARIHDGGGPLRDSRWLAVTDVDRARAASPGAGSLATGMRDRTELLRAELSELDARAVAARARARSQAEGDTLPRPEELARLDGERVVEPPAGGSATAVAVPVVAQRQPAVAAPVVIRGSRDRLRVGRVSLEAGIGLQREAASLERAGRTELAAARRAEGRARLEAAHAELEPLARVATASPAALFELARCEEGLGRTAVADALYAAVMERDRVRDPSGRVDYGAFGRAARTARAVMSWLSDTSDWRPRRDVDRIRWDDR